MYLYIDIDAFFASVEQSINRSIRNRPVMVGGLKHERGVVACPSYEARKLGVRTGTPLYEAARLLPDGVFLKGDFSRYEDYSRRFFDIIGSFSSRVDRISQDEACLEIGGTTRHFKDTSELAAQLQTRIMEELKLPASIGIAPSRVIAKMASEYKKPMGITVLVEDDIESFLENQPVRKIPGIGKITDRILYEMGVSTIGQLARIPEEYLKSVFGINGLKFAAYARGEDGISIRDYRAVRSISRETGFARNVTDRAVLLSHYYYLLERATRKLRDMSKRAASVKIKLRYSDFRTVEGAMRIDPASNCESRIFPLVETMFRRLFTRRLGIRLVGVTLCNLKNAVENESFIHDRAEKERRILKAIDSVRNRTGFFSVTTGRTLSLSESYKRGDTGYELRTPGLSQ